MLLCLTSIQKEFHTSIHFQTGAILFHIIAIQQLVFSVSFSKARNLRLNIFAVFAYNQTLPHKFEMYGVCLHEPAKELPRSSQPIYDIHIVPTLSCTTIKRLTNSVS